MLGAGAMVKFQASELGSATAGAATAADRAAHPAAPAETGPDAAFECVIMQSPPRMTSLRVVCRDIGRAGDRG